MYSKKRRGVRLTAPHAIAASGVTDDITVMPSAFKSVNDTHGHLVGDEVLQEIARRLLSCVRSYDFVGCYGGGEFLLILNNCKRQFAQARAEEFSEGGEQPPDSDRQRPLATDHELRPAAERQPGCPAGRRIAAPGGLGVVLRKSRRTKLRSAG
jgi:hypothetical protein